MTGTKAELFPSEFFVGDELDANWRERMTISGWDMRPMFDESKGKSIEKPVLLFNGRKPMPLNVTNFESLEKLTGKHSAAEFIGYTVTFYRTTDRRNKKPCIRIDETEKAEYQTTERANSMKQLRALRKQEAELLSKQGKTQTPIAREDADAMSDEAIVELIRQTESNVLDLRAALQAK